MLSPLIWLAPHPISRKWFIWRNQNQAASHPGSVGACWSEEFGYCTVSFEASRCFGESRRPQSQRSQLGSRKPGPACANQEKRRILVSPIRTTGAEVQFPLAKLKARSRS